jgi:DNA-binding transcriptional LysR family regulator
MNRADLADLSAFVAVADHLSFRAAASQLGVTPSALSHSMRQLEERLGVRLLNRTTRSVSVTDAGLRLLERLRPARSLGGEERHQQTTRLRNCATLALRHPITMILAPVRHMNSRIGGHNSSATGGSCGFG